ncbi:hypothetical protein LSAT2_032333 [Lamellibrachia satsuma]|nr:hypothetical protein LSAT2_032333 [Lamellibrachia satsuma]
MAEQAWHSKPEVTTMLQQFHEKYARQPTAAIEEAKPIHTKYTDYLAKGLKNLEICSRVEYTGSAYEGVKVSNDIEFDIMVIKKEGNHTIKAVQTPIPGYYYLPEGNSSNISPDKNVTDFCGTLQDLINKHPEMSRLVILRYHGPAVQMDVYRSEVDRTPNNVWYSVDVVLSYAAKQDQQECLLVAKPLKSMEGAPEVKDAWRLSFSLEEKELFDGMDRDNGCRKKVLRILKVLRNKEAGLKKLTSYHLKTALFYEKKEVSNWSQSELGPRLIGVLRRLYRDMEQGCQPHYFIPQINLLDGIAPMTIKNIKCRLEHILCIEHVFRGLFELK